MTDQSPQARAVDSADLGPARAIRRALADRGFKARDVGFVSVWATGQRARERAERAVERGLGRFAAGVRTSFDDPDVAGQCAAAIARGEARVAVALTIDPVAGDVARAFGRPRAEAGL